MASCFVPREGYTGYYETPIERNRHGQHDDRTG